MNEKIFEPTLIDDDQYKDLSSYNLEALFVLALLGGITPNIIHSLKNAKMLKLETGQRRKMRALSMMFWACELVLFGIFIKLDNVYAVIHVALYSRVISLGLYTYFYRMMRPKYKVVKFFKGELEPTIPTVIGWTIVGYNIELLMALIAGVIMSLF
jgi:hypothetical protein